MNRKEEMYKLANSVSKERTDEAYNSILKRANQAASAGYYMFKPFVPLLTVDWMDIMNRLQKDGFNVKIDQVISSGDFAQMRFRVTWYGTNDIEF